MPTTRYDRRAFLEYFGSVGLGTTLLPGILWAHAAQGEEITKATVECAEEIAGLTFDDEQRELMVAGLRQQAGSIATIRAVPLANSVPPALSFNPVLPGMTFEPVRRPMVRSRPAVPAVVTDVESLAFRPVTELSELVRTRRVTSTQLTRMYLSRLQRYDRHLEAVITLLEDRALQQAAAADAEIAGGRYRGPLHGIPWGAKDLLAVKGHPTTWGTAPYREQVIDLDATVVRRLDEAGAVLLAKLTLGELAYGDVWFGGMTRNPWKLEQGSSGSSAGSAATVSAGLVGFAIGSETLGSISSPSTRVGATGLRPTFGRVPRTGAMALVWTMDKLGPICRSVEDCALVLDAIHGPDGEDSTVLDLPFNWDANVRANQVRIGYVRAAFERDYPQKAFDAATLSVLRDLGYDLRPVELPSFEYGSLIVILFAEAAAAFDELTRSGRDREMKRQTAEAWPNSFRYARFLPAVEYINANRIRTLAMQEWQRLFSDLDVIVVPTSGPQLAATNLTGHPAVILPNGFRDDGTPVSITFLGNLYGEAKMLSVAANYQNATDFHLRTPPLPTA